MYTCATKGLWKVKQEGVWMWSLKLVDVHLVPASASHLLNSLTHSVVFFPCIRMELLIRKHVERHWGNFAEFSATGRTQQWWLGCCFPKYAVLHADQYSFVITFYSCISPFSSSILCTWIQACASLMSQIPWNKYFNSSKKF